MGIFIRGMEMPTSCGLCKLKTVVCLDKEKCLVSGIEFYSWEAGWGDEQRRHESCPLVPIPPHGDLIGRNPLIDIAMHLRNRAKDEYTKRVIGSVIRHIAEAPTIISAEGGET